MRLFKEWLSLIENDLDYETLFSQRDKTQQADVGKLLGFKKPLVKFDQGSIATIYQHPTDNNLLIKVTSHQEDIENIVRAQGLNSPNVVRVFPWENGKMTKSLPTLNSLAIIVEKVSGRPMVYTSSEFFDLSLNGKFDLAGHIIDGNLTPYDKKLYAKEIKKQSAILNNKNKNNPLEHSKLTSLFNALNELAGKVYSIEMSDIDQNIMDTGDRYVIIDMGF
jgi:hypothetical protein